MMHVLRAYDDYSLDDDMPAKNRAGRIVKGRMQDPGKFDLPELGRNYC